MTNKSHLYLNKTTHFSQYMYIYTHNAWSLLKLNTCGEDYFFFLNQAKCVWVVPLCITHKQIFSIYILYNLLWDLVQKIIIIV